MEIVIVILTVIVGSDSFVSEGAVVGSFHPEHKPTECVLGAGLTIIDGGDLWCLDEHGHIVVDRYVEGVYIGREG